ncbi:MAG: prepilin peptidase [Bacillota bacterium]|nr:prepilin peptidase [Bacillota bacterium]
MLYVAYGVIYGFAFLFGICIGSFLNVVIYRVPNHISVAKGRSFCPKCGESLKAIDLVPVVSFLCLKRRCRYCGEPISGRYPLVELLGGIFFVISVAVYGITWQSLITFMAACILIAIAFIDRDTMEIPNGLVLLLMIPALLTAIPILAINDATIISKLIGVVAVALPMILMNLIISNSFGGGDIKLMAVCGFMLGWQSELVAIFIGLVTGGIYGIYLMTSGKKGRKDHFAFGPFLVVGIMVALYMGPALIGWYTSLFGL